MKPWIEMLAALGQEARLEIFRLLVRAGPEGRCVEDIRRGVGIPGSTLSHHLDTLTRCGLLEARREGRFIHYSVGGDGAAALVRFLTENCCVDRRSSGAGCAETPERMPVQKPRARARDTRRSRR